MKNEKNLELLFIPICLVIICAVIAAVILTGSAGAALPGKNGDILTSESGLIRSVGPKSGTARKVAEGGQGYTPKAFPDGRSIAYIGGSYARNSIYIRKIRGGGLKYKGRAIFTRPTQGAKGLGLRALSVSRGSRIVFAATSVGYNVGRPSRRIEIYTVRRDGSGLTRLTRNRLFENDPALSPDGSRIAFVRRIEGDAEIWTMNIDGSGQRKLTRGPGFKRSPSFSPNGDRITYFGSAPREGLDRWAETEIFTASSRTGRDRIRVSRDRGSSFYPSYSPNGRSITWVSGDDLRVSRVNGAKPHNVFRSRDGGGITWTDWAPRP